MCIFINGQAPKSFIYPGGEVSVNISNISITAPVRIRAYMKSSDDFFRLVMCVDALRRAGHKELSLEMPYVPYGRQDRVCNPGESFSLEVFANLINSLRFSEVLVQDCHSIETNRLINNCKEMEMYQLLDVSPVPSKVRHEDVILVAPDKGAEEKVKKSAKRCGADYIVANKIRDPGTGEILEVSVEGVIQGRDYLILDDICDGGATFINLSKLLKKQGARQVHLHVTHGIFSRGIQHVMNHLDSVTCHNDLRKFKYE